MFGLSFEKFVLVGIIAALIIGPSRLPAYAQKLGEAVRLLRAQIDSARNRAAESVGAEDWPALDPRQYDPRRIVREALIEPDPVRSAGSAASCRCAQSERGSSEPGSSEQEPSEVSSVREAAKTAPPRAAARSSEAPIAEAAGRYVITGSSGHPRRRIVARTADGRAGDEERADSYSGAAAHSETAVRSGATAFSDSSVCSGSGG